MPTEELERSVGFLLSDVSRLMRKRFDARARALGLTRAQWRVLHYLQRFEGITQSALAEILEIENITLGRHIDRLQESAWVERRRDPADRRVWRLYLSPRAQPILDRLGRLSAETREEALAGLSEEERKRLIEILLSIKANLIDLESAPQGASEAGNTDRAIAE